jgi:lysophospholipase L1-like esterase
MKNLLFIFLFFSICVKSQTYIGKPDTVYFSGKTVVFIGNSITAGFNSSDNAHRYVNIFATTKSATLSNLGISGQVLQNGTVCIGNTFPIFDKTTIPTFISSTYAELFIALGVNDIGLNSVGGAVPLTSAQYALTYDTVLNYAISTKGWPPHRITIVTPFWFTNYAFYNSYTGCGHVQADTVRHQAYVAASIAEGQKWNCTIADAYTAMNSSVSKGTFLSGDGLHPNDTGHAFIASFLLSVKYLQ